MKNLITIGVLLCWACTKPIDHEAEKAIITKLIDDETKFAAAADSAKWASCWVNTMTPGSCSHQLTNLLNVPEIECTWCQNRWHRTL